jgi:hypothetical protein
MGKKSAAQEIRELMNGGKKPSQIIKERPDLASGFDDLVTTTGARKRTARGSGADGDIANANVSLPRAQAPPY